LLNRDVDHGKHHRSLAARFFQGLRRQVAAGEDHRNGGFEQFAGEHGQARRLVVGVLKRIADRLPFDPSERGQPILECPHKMGVDFG
jgi:hypothetical protein